MSGAMIVWGGFLVGVVIMLLFGAYSLGVAVEEDRARQKRWAERQQEAKEELERQQESRVNEHSKWLSRHEVRLLQLENPPPKKMRARKGAR